MTESWLDKVIAEQANYYGMTVEEFKRWSEDMAKAQEEEEKCG